MSAGSFHNAEAEAKAAREAAEAQSKLKDANWRTRLRRKGTGDSQ